ncbi:MAG TPA: DUF6787 family protein [Ignavibacteriales bacterium]|nr:DUF6787 family protein [Ignavibacteriales bacterium]
MKFNLTKKNTLDFFLIMTVFALTGFSSVIVSGFIARLFGVTPWTLGYAAVFLFFIFPVYHIMILCYAFIFGKFDYFFGRYKWIFEKLKSLAKMGKAAPEEK